jgi:hypothetical protein
MNIIYLELITVSYTALSCPYNQAKVFRDSPSHPYLALRALFFSY